VRIGNDNLEAQEMSDGGGGQQVSRTELPPWLQGHAQNYLEQAGNVASTPYTPYTEQRVAGLTPVQQSAIQGTANLAGGTGSMASGENMLQNTLGGGYLNSPWSQRNAYAGASPFFGDLMQQSMDKITKNYKEVTAPDANAAAVLNGTLGGGDHQRLISKNQENLASQLGQVATQMGNDQYNRSAGLEESFLGRGSGNYNFERGNQMQAVGASTGLADAFGRTYQNALNAGNVERGNYQDLLNSRYGDFTEQRNYPREQLGVFGGAVNSLMGGAGKTQITDLPPPDRTSQALGYAMLANNAYNSYNSGGK
jgi:hypothetical protein